MPSFNKESLTKINYSPVVWLIGIPIIDGVILYGFTRALKVLKKSIVFLTLFYNIKA